MLRNILAAAVLTVFPAATAFAQCEGGFCRKPAQNAPVPTTRVKVTQSEYDVPVASQPELPAAVVLPAPVVSAPLFTSTVVSAPVITYGSEVVATGPTSSCTIVRLPIYSEPVYSTPVFEAPVFVGGAYSFRSRTVVKTRSFGAPVFAGPAGCYGFVGTVRGCPSCR